MRRNLSVCITSLALSLPPLSFLLTLAQSKLMERLEMISNVLTAATADVKISEEKQKSASSTNTPELSMQISYNITENIVDLLDAVSFIKARSSSSLARTWMDWKRLRDSEKFPLDLGASPAPKFSSSSPSPTSCPGRLSSSWTAVMLPALLLLLLTECPPPSDPSRQSQGIVWFH